MSEKWPYGTVLQYSTGNVRVMVISDHDVLWLTMLYQDDPVWDRLPIYKEPVWKWTVGRGDWTVIDES
jgi:hypothetical protein